MVNSKWFCVATLATALVASSASAQDVNVQRFSPAAGPHGVFSVEYGRTLEHLAPTAGVTLNYSSRPLVLTGADGDSTPIVDQQLATHVHGGLGITEWLQFDVDVPVYLVNDVTIAGEDLSGVTLGDVRFRPKASFLNAEDSLIGVGLLVDLRLPIGDNEAQVGKSSFGVTPKLLFDIKAGDFQLGINAGASFQGADELAAYEDSNGLEFGAGAEYTLLKGLLVVGAEVFGRSDFGDLFAPTSTPLEGLFGAKLITSSGVAVTGAAGGGFTNGVGSPEFRTILGISWASRNSDYDDDGIENSDDDCPQDPEDLDGFEDTDGCPEADNDLDGIADSDDACPDEAEDKDEFKDEDGCPEDDNDEDGIKDVDDTCPNEAEDRDGFEDADGCPDLDNDGDNIPDTEDKCDDQAEDMDGWKDEDGCPEPDNDLDGLADVDDQCPNEPGLPKDNGCPPKEAKAVLEKSQIKILDRVYFETGKAIIKVDSFNLLDQVGLILRSNPQVVSLEIGGHTDDRGKADMNQKLSEERAKSVRDYLVKAGIDASRLTAVGYGEAQPIDIRKSKAARARNRRVEFKILDQGATEGDTVEATEPAAAPEKTAPE